MRKSHCCGAGIRRFGRRRRQCCACLRTWRVRIKKRGRPSLRSDPRLIARVLLQRRSLTELAYRRGVSKQALSHRFLTELIRRFRYPCELIRKPSRSSLILDGLWFLFRRRPWVVYLMALKPLHSSIASFLKPCLFPGRESQSSWEKAIGTIPLNWRNQVQAVIVDDFTGSNTLAKRHKWVLQLCHFHMLARLRARLGYRRPGGVSMPLLRQQAYRLVRIALGTDDPSELEKVLKELKEKYVQSSLPWKYRNMLRQFLRRIDAYRAYRLHPNLNLPKTTGSAESMGRVIRDLMRRTRSLRTPKALELWVSNYIRLRPDVVCNPAEKSTN